MYPLNSEYADDFEGDSLIAHYITGRTFYYNKRRPGIGTRPQYWHRKPKRLVLVAARSLADYMRLARSMENL